MWGLPVETTGTTQMERGQGCSEKSATDRTDALFRDSGAYSFSCDSVLFLFLLYASVLTLKGKNKKPSCEVYCILGMKTNKNLAGCIVN